MKEEVRELIQLVLKHYPSAKEPTIDWGDFKKTGEVSSQIITLFEENKMTYTEAYAVLSFTHEALKFKSEKTYL